MTFYSQALLERARELDGAAARGLGRVPAGGRRVPAAVRRRARARCAQRYAPGGGRAAAQREAPAPAGRPGHAARGAWRACARGARTRACSIAGTGEEEAALKAQAARARPRRRGALPGPRAQRRRWRGCRARPTCSCCRPCWRPRPPSRWRRWPAARRSSPPTTRAALELRGHLRRRRDGGAAAGPGRAGARRVLALPGARRAARAPRPRRSVERALPPATAWWSATSRCTGGARGVRTIDDARHRAEARGRASAASTTTRCSSTCAAPR